MAIKFLMRHFNCLRVKKMKRNIRNSPLSGLASIEPLRKKNKKNNKNLEKQLDFFENDAIFSNR